LLTEAETVSLRGLGRQLALLVIPSKRLLRKRLLLLRDVILLAADLLMGAVEVAVEREFLLLAIT
jgi:hypothetical protein